MAGKNPYSNQKNPKAHGLQFFQLRIYYHITPNIIEFLNYDMLGKIRIGIR